MGAYELTATGDDDVSCGQWAAVHRVPLMGDIGRLAVSRIQECCDSMHNGNLVFCTNQLTSHDLCSFANLGQLMLVRCILLSMFQKVLTPPDNHSDGGLLLRAKCLSYLRQVT